MADFPADDFHRGRRSVIDYLHSQLNRVKAPPSIQESFGTFTDQEMLWMRITGWTTRLEIEASQRAFRDPSANPDLRKVFGDPTQGSLPVQTLQPSFYKDGPPNLLDGPLMKTAADYRAVGNEALSEDTPSMIRRKKMMAEKPLSDDQKIAWEKALRWLGQDKDPYFVLRGFAGTGKTFLMSLLLTVDSHSFLFTAPTNKATKVLSKMMGHPAKTIYSLLGIKMGTNEDQQEIEFPDDLPSFSKSTVIVIDEAGMVPEALFHFLEAVREKRNIKIMYVGDPAQLNPVKEPKSLSWNATENPKHRTMMKQVMRFDNELLDLSIKIRACLINKDYASPIESNHSNNQGVYLMSSSKWESSLLRDAEPAKYMMTKVIAWRNKTVNRYNSLIRDAIGFKQEYEVGDVLLLAKPVTYDTRIIGTIDEEGQVTSVVKGRNTIDDIEIPVWAVELKREGDSPLALAIPRGDSAALESLLSRKARVAQQAKKNERREAWQEFWRIKNSFHYVRYGYALTAHRAQGSTYTDVYIDQGDILANSNKREAMRCLYVAATRPSNKLLTF